MKIETKFDINEELFYIVNGRVTSGKVVAIETKVDSKEINTTSDKGLLGTGNYKVADLDFRYSLKPKTGLIISIKSHLLFRTKEELIASL